MEQNFLRAFCLSSSSSVGTTAHCGLWPVEKCPSIFSYLPPTPSIFSLPALEDPFLGLPLLLVPSSSWVKIFLGILSSSILSSWPNQLILCPFIYFTIFSPLLISSSSRFVRLFHSPFSYLGPYILPNISLSKISRACSYFFVNVHASAPYDTTGILFIACHYNSPCPIHFPSSTTDAIYPKLSKWLHLSINNFFSGSHIFTYTSIFVYYALFLFRETAVH